MCNKQSSHSSSLHSDCHSKWSTALVSQARRLSSFRHSTVAVHTRQQIWRGAFLVPCLSRKLCGHRIQPELLHAPALSIPKPVSLMACRAQSIVVAHLAWRVLVDGAAVVAVVSFPVLVPLALDVAFVALHRAHSWPAYSASLSFLAPCGSAKSNSQSLHCLHRVFTFVCVCVVKRYCVSHVMLFPLM